MQKRNKDNRAFKIVEASSEDIFIKSAECYFDFNNNQTQPIHFLFSIRKETTVNNINSILTQTQMIPLIVLCNKEISRCNCNCKFTIRKRD